MARLFIVCCKAVIYTAVFFTSSVSLLNFYAERTSSSHLGLSSAKLKTSIISTTRTRSDLCDLKYWIYGTFVKNVFVPRVLSEEASLRTPKSNRFVVQNSPKYHWFDKHEAQDCLRNKRIWVIGDSYMRHLYTGLMDVIRGQLKHPNDSSTQSRKKPEDAINFAFMPAGFQSRQAYIESSNITSTFVGRNNFGIGLYLDPVKVILSHIKNDDLIVFNVLIHDNKQYRVESKQFRGNMKAAEIFYLMKISELSKWVKKQKFKAKFVWSTSNSYKEEKVHKVYRRYQKNKRILDINKRARYIWLSDDFPVLDVFHLTQACRAHSCTSDGSHYNRMVNRAKAHVLLNYFCRPAECLIS